MPGALAIPVDVRLLGDDDAGLAAFARAADRAGIARLRVPGFCRSAAGTPAEVRERARECEVTADRLWATPPRHRADADARRRFRAGILEALHA